MLLGTNKNEMRWNTRTTQGSKFQAKFEKTTLYIRNSTTHFFSLQTKRVHCRVLLTPKEWGNPKIQKKSLNLQDFAQNKIVAYKWCTDIFFNIQSPHFVVIPTSIAYRNPKP